MIIIAAALYVAAVYLAPQLVTVPFTSLTATAVDDRIQHSKPGQYGDRLFLPQINIDVAVQVGGGSEALKAGAWQRSVGLGDPAKSGNVVIAAPKFTFAPTPMAARAQSPFYNLGKLNPGDQITMDYKGVRYVYQIDRKLTVTAGDSLEKPSSDARMTLYAVDEKGNTVAGVALSGKQISPVKQASDGSFSGKSTE